jgi:hypothetical protein
MEEHPGRVRDIVEAFRAHGGGPQPLILTPGFLLGLGIWAGDLVAKLGWTPPIRSTAILEMRRGVTGDPAPWMAKSGIVPLSARQALLAVPVSVQENWFARLYLLKAVALVTLVIFWCADPGIPGGTQYSFDARLFVSAGARHHPGHQRDGFSHRLRHRLAAHQPHWTDRGHRCVGRLYGGIRSHRSRSLA